MTFFTGRDARIYIRVGVCVSEMKLNEIFGRDKRENIYIGLQCVIYGFFGFGFIVNHQELNVKIKS